MEPLVRGVWVVAYRELLRYAQERSRIVSSFAMPLTFLAIFGAGLNRSIGPLTPGVNFIQYVYPGVIAMTVLTTSLTSGVSVVWDREFGFLKELLVAPLSRAGVVLGKAAGGVAVALIQGLVMLVLAPAVGVSVSPGLVVKLVPLLVLIGFAFSGLGLVLASRMRSLQGFQPVMQMVVFPLVFLSGIFFPLNNAPRWMEVLSRIDPVTYGVDAVRRLFLAGASAAEEAPVLGVRVLGHTTGMFADVLVVALLGAALMSAAVWSFNREG